MKFMFDREKTLGEGAFSRVYKGKLWYSSSMRLKGFRSRKVAVKRVKKHFAKEIEKEAMLKLNHPNIVRLFHCEKDNNFIYYAMELCDACLNQLFRKSDDPQKYNGRMPRQIEVFHQLATGLAYIHSKKLIHRDIKPHNILIMRRPGKHEEIIIKWCDFGMAKSVNEKGNLLWSGERGTRIWWAPEVLKKFINENNADTEEFWGTVKSDVFALGLIFGYLFLEGKHLFGSIGEIHKNIIRNDPVNMKNIDGELLKYYADDLLRKMLEHEPEKRISSKEVVEQLESIKNKLNEKEEEFRQLCAEDSSPDLLGRINDFIRLGIDVNAKDFDERNALHYLCKSNSSPNLIDAIQLLVKLGTRVISKGHDARIYLRDNDKISNKNEILKLLDEAILV